MMTKLMITTKLSRVIRQLLRFPLSNGTVILTIALLTGGLSAIYASIRHEQEQLLPFPKSERLLKLWRIADRQAVDFFPSTIIGVMPSAVRTTRVGSLIEVWRPLHVSEQRLAANLRIVGRLKPHVSVKQAQAELTVIAPSVEEAYAPDRIERAVYPNGFHRSIRWKAASQVCTRSIFLSWDSPQFGGVCPMEERQRTRLS